MTHTCGFSLLSSCTSPLYFRVHTTLLRLISWKDTENSGPKANGFLYFHFLELYYRILTHTSTNFFPFKTYLYLWPSQKHHLPSPTSLKLLLWPQLWLDVFIITWPISLVSLLFSSGPSLVPRASTTLITFIFKILDLISGSPLVSLHQSVILPFKEFMIT